MSERAEIKFDSTFITQKELVSLIEDLGYEAELLKDGQVDSGKVELLITGMTCSSCVHLIETALRKVDGVKSASVALATSKGVIDHDPDVVGIRQLIEIIQTAGHFTASVAASRQAGEHLSHSREIRKWCLTFLLCLVFAIPTMAVAMGLHSSCPDLVFPGLSVRNLILWIFCTIIQVCQHVWIFDYWLILITVWWRCLFLRFRLSRVETQDNKYGRFDYVGYDCCLFLFSKYCLITWFSP